MKNDLTAASSRILILFLFGFLELSVFLGCENTESPVIPLTDLTPPSRLVDLEARAEYYRQQLLAGERSIPRGWFKTKDPALFAEYFRAQLIKQFGDIPEVHTLADIELKTRSQIPLTQDEMIRNLEATYELWPDPRTLKSLERLQKDKAAGKPFVMVYSEPGDTPEQVIQKLIQRRKEMEQEDLEEVDEPNE